MGGGYLSLGERFLACAIVEVANKPEAGGASESNRGVKELVDERIVNGGDDLVARSVGGVELAEHAKTVSAEGWFRKSAQWWLHCRGSDLVVARWARRKVRTGSESCVLGGLDGKCEEFEHRVGIELGVAPVDANVGRLLVSSWDG